MESAGSLLRAHVVVGGHVQGVFFRALVRERAFSLGVTGWVRNRPDGKVECVFEGQADNVTELVNLCRQGPRSARVEEFDVKWEDHKREFGTFSVSR